MNLKLSILIVDDEDSVRESLQLWFTEDGYRVDCAENAIKALDLLEKQEFDIILADIKMPGMDGLELLRRIKSFNNTSIVIIMTAFATVDTAVKALKDGAFDYITKPFDPDDLSHLIRNASRQVALSRENETLKNRVDSLLKIDDFIGKSDGIRKVLNEVESVAPTQSSVIITGESGTGKELIAKAIHANSSRKYYPMVSVHCGALTESLLESELFGHEKGAFTDAKETRKGRFELADGGTLFLDEIGDISSSAQVKLLRVLQEREFERVGGSKTIKVNVRLVAATNRNLEQMVKDGTFREDLYYRLNVIPIDLPPLRERGEDIKLLVNFFLERSMKNHKKRVVITDEAMDKLMSYPWPGNVRELENTIERIVLMGDEDGISATDMLLLLPALNNKTLIDEYKTIPMENKTLEDIEKEAIEKALRDCKNNQTEAAKQLGITLRQLGYKIKMYGLK